MNPPEREKRTTDHPVAYTVKPGERKDGGLDVGKRMGVLAAISAGVALLVRRTIYPTLLQVQPKDLPVTLPSDFGFFVAGAGVTSLTLGARKKQYTTRRCFFYSMAAGMGAAIGAKLGGALEWADANDLPYDPIPVAGKDEDDPAVEKCEEEPGSDDTDSNHAIPPLDGRGE